MELEKAGAVACALQERLYSDPILDEVIISIVVSTEGVQELTNNAKYCLVVYLERNPPKKHLLPTNYLGYKVYYRIIGNIIPAAN